MPHLSDLPRVTRMTRKKVEFRKEGRKEARDALCTFNFEVFVSTLPRGRFELHHTLRSGVFARIDSDGIPRRQSARH